MSKYIKQLRQLVNDLHTEHGVGGASLSCLECVVVALNMQEDEYLRRIKEYVGE